MRARSKGSLAAHQQSIPLSISRRDPTEGHRRLRRRAAIGHVSLPRRQNQTSPLPDVAIGRLPVAIDDPRLAQRLSSRARLRLSARQRQTTPGAVAVPTQGELTDNRTANQFSFPMSRVQPQHGDHAGHPRLAAHMITFGLAT